MKTKIFAMFFGAILFVSCQQKEMKISRSDFSVVSEITDISPAYIIVNEKGNTELKKNSLIGNTHWVLSVDRDLSLKEIGPFLQELTQKKHKKGGMHEDSKDIYFVYSDTVHKQNAYVKLPFKTIDIGIPSLPNKDSIEYNNIHVKSFANFNEQIDEYLRTGIVPDKLHLVFDQNISTEEFLNILIKVHKLNLSSSVDIFTSFM